MHLAFIVRDHHAGELASPVLAIIRHSYLPFGSWSAL